MTISFADRMRTTRPSAMLFGLLVFFIFIPVMLLPVVGILIWLILGPYFGARMALWEHRERAIPYAALLGVVEASIIVSAVLLLLDLLRGFILLETLEWMAVTGIFAACIVFSIIGAWTLPERSMS